MFLQNFMSDIGVSLSEIIEVRGCGLNDDELLALIIISCEVLTRVPAGVFSPEYVVLHTDGELEVCILMFIVSIIFKVFPKCSVLQKQN